MNLASLVDKVASSVNYTLEVDRRAALVRWLELLKTWNARIDLTAAKNDEALCELMLTDALVLAGRIARNARVVDVGSGAGAPGLALALARADLAVTLIEPLAKRVSFLRTVVGTLGRADIVLERAKGEDARARGARWDIAISRATLAPSAWLELGASLVPHGGSVWVLLAKEPAPALAGASIAEEASYALPFSGNARRAVRYETASPAA